MLLKVSLLCLLASLASCAIVNINKEVDEWLANYRKGTIESNTTYINIDHVTEGQYDLKKVSFGDMSTTKRTGDAIIRTWDENYIVTESFGLDKMRWEVQEFTKGGKTGPATFVIKDNSVSMRIKVLKKGDSCKCIWEKYEMDRLSDVTMHSPVPEWDGADVSKLFQSEIRAYINKYFKSDAFRKVLEQYYDLCKWPSQFSSFASITPA